MLRAATRQTASTLIAAVEGWQPLRVFARPIAAWKAAMAAMRAPAPAEAAAASAAAGGSGALPQGPGLDLARADWEDRLWGPGFLLPGGEAEVMRLATVLPVSPATTLMLLGRDAGGAAHAIAAQRGAWMVIHLHDPLLIERAAPRVFPHGRRAQIQPWSPAAPGFRAKFHHLALALEPIRCGAAPEVLLQALAAAMRAQGQILLLETVARKPPPEHEAAFRRWLALEGRSAPPPSQAAIDRAIHHAGFNLHVVEDLGARHSAAATEGWARMITGLKGEHRPRTKDAAAALVLEAEAWLLRHRLVAAGVLSVLRWHASLKSF